MATPPSRGTSSLPFGGTSSRQGCALCCPGGARGGGGGGRREAAPARAARGPTLALPPPTTARLAPHRRSSAHPHAPCSLLAHHPRQYSEDDLKEEVEMMKEGGSWVDFNDGRTT